MSCRWGRGLRHEWRGWELRHEREGASGALLLRPCLSARWILTRWCPSPDRYTTAVEVQRALRNIGYIGSFTNHAAALRTARTRCFNSAGRGRCVTLSHIRW